MQPEAVAGDGVLDQTLILAHFIQRRESASYLDSGPDTAPFDRARHSPTMTAATTAPSHYRHHSPPYASTRSHPSSRIGSISQSPVKTSRESPARYHDYGYPAAETTVAPLKSPSITSEVSDPLPCVRRRSRRDAVLRPLQRSTEADEVDIQKHDRTPNPMAFSSILSDANPEPSISSSARRKASTQVPSTSPPPPAPPPPPPPPPPLPPVMAAPGKEPRKSSRQSPSHGPSENHKAAVPTPRANTRSSHGQPSRTMADRAAKSRPAPPPPPPPPPPSEPIPATPTSSVTTAKAKKRKKKKVAAPIQKDLTARLMAAAVDEIALTDLDSPEFEDDKQKFRQRSLKRMADVAEAEGRKRKARAPSFFPSLSLPLAVPRGPPSVLSHAFYTTFVLWGTNEVSRRAPKAFVAPSASSSPPI